MLDYDIDKIDQLRSNLNHMNKDIMILIEYADADKLNLDKEKLIKLRKKQNISIGSFARSVKVSRRTVRMYEEGMNARVEFAKRIEELLKDTITVDINLLNKNKR